MIKIIEDHGTEIRNELERWLTYHADVPNSVCDGPWGEDGQYGHLEQKGNDGLLGDDVNVSDGQNFDF